MRLKNARRMFAGLCVLALVLSTLPLYAIALYNHPYYDDYGFSAPVHQVWKETGDLGQVFTAAMEAAENTRETWQGTYTGTILSNLQPGLFDESLYWIGNWFLLTALIACMAFFLMTAFGTLGVQKSSCVSLASLALIVMIQFMPDVGEAFFWFNGGIGNTFVYALIALAAALCIRLYRTRGRGWALTAALAVLAVLLGGGSYGGGLFVLCTGAVGLAWVFLRKNAKRWHFAGLLVLFAGCFLYSMAAPGNTVRAGYIRYEGSVVKTVLQSFYYGVGQMGESLRLPLIAVALLMAPALHEAAQKSRFRFAHPWLVLGLGACLYCTQFAPPLYAIASIGDGRIVNTYFISFVVLWFFAVYYLLGFLARRERFELRRSGALLVAAVCLLGMGSLAFRRPGDVLYGAQNLSGPSALLSILSGEAAQYDREMTAREVVLNDETQPEITLAPLSAVPGVFMEDHIQPNAVYDVRPSLRLYYGKEAIHIAGEEMEE